MLPTDLPAKRRSPLRRLFTWLWRLLVAFVAGSVALVLLFRFVDPPTSAMMIERRLEAVLARDHAFTLRQQWVDATAIAPGLAIAVVAAEDQKFPLHHGFDLESIESALERNGKGGRVHGASTISQQVAKNLFLWSGRSWVRKGFEAWFTVLIEAAWPKRRILEAYLNVAEFGDGVYGAEAASRAFFGKPAAALGEQEATLLAAVLPNPRAMHAARPSPYVRERAAWIARQARQLGGPAYLDAH
jgi:monofunctional biosynthetic peptidoglycan transglycosylase